MRRTVETRIKGHRRGYPEKSMIAEHCIHNGQRIDFDGTKLLLSASSLWDHLAKEAIEIKPVEKNFNKDEGLTLICCAEAGDPTTGVGLREGVDSRGRDDRGLDHGDRDERVLGFRGRSKRELLYRGRAERGLLTRDRAESGSVHEQGREWLIPHNFILKYFQGTGGICLEWHPLPIQLSWFHCPLRKGVSKSWPLHLAFSDCIPSLLPKCTSGRDGLPVQQSTFQDETLHLLSSSDKVLLKTLTWSYSLTSVLCGNGTRSRGFTTGCYPTRQGRGLGVWLAFGGRGSGALETGRSKAGVSWELEDLWAQSSEKAMQRTFNTINQRVVCYVSSLTVKWRQLFLPY
ncbi:uncharacterized protein LOC132381757 [Hypanus sabinus]|uniref:uncharacterized protein LOC132381757 n=1 Tax=Hypanus sabinus TaxID=79690 RepID=UPI0028C3AA1B|nr:uncharacterized protein LOC132381757 [Hypanus sabinus]